MGWHLAFFESGFKKKREKCPKKKKLRFDEQRVYADDTGELRAQAMHGLPVR